MSDQPDLTRERVVYAESADQVYVYDQVNNWWEAWGRADDDRDGVGYDTEELPDDAGPLYSPERWPHPEKVRADAAEAKLAEVAAERDRLRIREIRQSLNLHGVGSVSEAVALALGDAYAGIEFEDSTFERGTRAVMAALREHFPANASPSVSSPEGGETPTPEKPELDTAIGGAADREYFADLRARIQDRKQS